MSIMHTFSFWSFMNKAGLALIYLSGLACPLEWWFLSLLWLSGCCSYHLSNVFILYSLQIFQCRYAAALLWQRIFSVLTSFLIYPDEMWSWLLRPQILHCGSLPHLMMQWWHDLVARFGFCVAIMKPLVSAVILKPSIGLWRCTSPSFIQIWNPG